MTRPLHRGTRSGVSTAPRPRPGPIRGIAGAAVLAFVLAACSSGEDISIDIKPPAGTAAPAPSAGIGQQARILTPSAPTQCVPYARQVSGIPIRGDAWTWWRTAQGRYPRSSRPAIGSILTLKRTQRLRFGHIAVVRRIVNNRIIVVDHANWLNRGRIHQATPVIDVSAANDWSAVRVWYTPGRKLGARTYAAYGFVHAGQMISSR